MSEDESFEEEGARHAREARERAARDPFEGDEHGSQFESEGGSDGEANEPEPSWSKPADVLRRVKRPKARFATGYAALDQASRGGAPTGGLLIIQGGPDSGKTGLAVQVAVKIGLEHKVPVWIYTSDGGAESTAVRVGLLLGFDGERLDQRDVEEVQKLDEALAERSIFIVTDGPEMNLGGLIAEAEALDPETPHILVVDSIQETPPGVAGATERDIVNANVRLLRGAKASKVPWLILATSEVVKSAYATRKGSKQTNPLAAGSDSAKIGYAASMMINLSGDPAKGPHFGQAAVIKNKLGGGKPSFELRLETPSLKLVGREPEVEDDRPARDSGGKEERIRPFAEKVWCLLFEEGPKNGSELVEKFHCHDRRITQAVAFLGSRVAITPGPRNSRIYRAVGGAQGQR